MELSIITPVLNGERFIRKNIESVLKLNIKHEHIIVDGGSTDKTLEILNEYPHLVVVHQLDHTGMYGAIKQGFEASHGNILTWVNCDDWIIPENYDRMVSNLISKRADIAYSDSYIHFEKSGKDQLSRTSLFPRYFIKHGLLPFIQPATVYTKDFYNRIGGLNSKYKITGDMDMFYRMALANKARFIICKYPTVSFLKYGESLGDMNTEKGHREREDAGIPYPTIMHKSLFHLFRIIR